MTYLDIAAKVLHMDEDPLKYRELVHVCALTCPSYFKECPKDQVQAFEYYFRTIHRFASKMPKHQISKLLEKLNQQN